MRYYVTRLNYSGEGKASLFHFQKKDALLCTKKKLIFLSFISFLSFNLQSADSTKVYKATGHKLQGYFHLELTTNGITLRPGKDFSGFGSDKIEGFTGVKIGLKKVFFNLENNQPPITLSNFFSNKIHQEERTKIIRLFFNGNETETMIDSFNFKNGYEVTLKDGSQALVLTPQISTTDYHD